MVQIPRDLEHSRRRARLREKVLVELADRRVATLGELSDATGIRASRILGILEGDGREYAYDLSLVAQGAASVHELFGGRGYVITPEGGREVARLVAA